VGSPSPSSGIASAASGVEGLSIRCEDLSSPPCHRGERVCRLCSAVSGIGQQIEIASQAVQACLDGSRRHPFGCPAGLGSFLAIVTRRQRWRLFGLVHERRIARGAMDRGHRLRGEGTTAKDVLLTLAGAVC
jgi:hypothetical protein